MPCYIENQDNENIDIKGDKNIDIKIFGKEKRRITIVLRIITSWEKLPPLLILKDKPWKKKENELRKYL